MTLNKLLPSCPCGGLVAVVNLYITDTKVLLTTGMCTVCDQQIKIAWPLAELFRKCPKPERTDPVKPPLNPPVGETDTDFLHSLGISEGAENELPQA